MKMMVLLLAVILMPKILCAQEFKVEFDKDQDLSSYKTFRMGEGAIITPADERTIPDASLHKWVREAIIKELKSKGLVLDSTSDLTVSYLAGSDRRTDTGNVGPLGMSPGQTSSQTYLRDYEKASLVIDINDRRLNKLIWRVSASTESTMGETERFVDQVVGKGFKKFKIHPKGKKKKK